MVATYATPSILRRWLAMAESEVEGDREATQIVNHLVRRLERHWVASSALPAQIVHGDIKLSNVGLQPAGSPLFLDFGFAACRTRVHELAYALAFMVIAQ